MTKSVEISLESGQQLVENYNCRRRHQIDGNGALKAPNLAGITVRLDEVAIRIWLKNPKSVKGNTAMPNFHLSDSEIEAIVAYLLELVAATS
ncbi:MAG: c-type cytochrome [Anaerolineae bacterium]